MAQAPDRTRFAFSQVAPLLGKAKMSFGHSFEDNIRRQVLVSVDGTHNIRGRTHYTNTEVSLPGQQVANLPDIIVATLNTNFQLRPRDRPPYNECGVSCTACVLCANCSEDDDDVFGICSRLLWARWHEGRIAGPICRWCGVTQRQHYLWLSVADLTKKIHVSRSFASHFMKLRRQVVNNQRRKYVVITRSTREASGTHTYAADRLRGLNAAAGSEAAVGSDVEATRFHELLGDSGDDSQEGLALAMSDPRFAENENVLDEDVTPEYVTEASNTD